MLCLGVLGRGGAVVAVSRFARCLHPPLLLRPILTLAPKTNENKPHRPIQKTPLGVIADSEAMVRSSEAGEWTGRNIDDMFVDISESELDGDEVRYK